MISSFLREQKRYSQKELCLLLKCKEAKLVEIIKKLKEYGVVKSVRRTETQRNLSDLNEIDVEVSDVSIGDNEVFYVFTYVGVIIIAGHVLKCYPKYLLSNSNPVIELRQVLKVLEKYNSEKQTLHMHNNAEEIYSFNFLSNCLFLLHDYYNNGLYTNYRDIIETNGLGEIHWERTINNTFTLLSEGKPYYPELRTRKRISNDLDYFRRLHECIVTTVSNELKRVDLLDLFDISELELCDSKLDDFGDKEYILYRIENELSIQFNTRKQLVLKAMYAYIDNSNSINDIDCISMFGTNCFNLVWEEVCKFIFNNRLNQRISSLKMPRELDCKYNPNSLLIDVIEKPFWSITGKVASDTLIPDLISIADKNFIIMDAKYYTPKLVFGEPPLHQPGIESVTKQYLYQLAYNQFITTHGFTTVRNLFLLPTESNCIRYAGTVSMNMFKQMNLNDIEVMYIPASTAYQYYLSGKRVDSCWHELPGSPL